MNKSILKFSQSGDLNVRGEVIQIPEVLRGTGNRNLLQVDTSMEVANGVREFIQFADLAPIFDAYGLIFYTISFDIKSKDTSKQKTMSVYLQNGSGAKYNFQQTIPVTTEYVRQSVTVKPTLSDASIVQAQLAFYGTYDTGNIPCVKNVKVEIGTKKTLWSQSPEFLGCDWLPQWMQNFNTPISYSENGDMAVVGELIEIPSELRGTGGKNLLKNSKDLQMHPNNTGLGTSTYLTDKGYWNVKADPAKSISTFIATFPQIGVADLETGADYTYSVDVMSEISGRASVYGGPQFPINAGEWTRIYYTKRYESEVRPPGLISSLTELNYRNYKIEKGSKVSPWSPAPEDISINWIPEDIHNFNSPLAVSGKSTILGGELSEVADAISTDGSTGYVSFPAAVKTLLQGKAEATIEFWCKKNTVLGSAGYGFFQLSGYQNANGNLYPYNDPMVAYLDTFKTSRLGPIALKKSAGEWHHFAVTTKPGTNGWNLYQNGQLVYSTTGESSVSVNYADFTIGLNSGNRFAHAYFKEVRLWDVAKTQKEIQDNMSSTVRPEANGLVGYWKMNEGHGTTILDHSQNNNHGIAVGGVEWIYTLDAEGS